jgi:hypothetical protein
MEAFCQKGLRKIRKSLRIAGLRLTNRAVDLARRKMSPDCLASTSDRELLRITIKKNSEISKKYGSWMSVCFFQSFFSPSSPCANFDRDSGLVTLVRSAVWPSHRHSKCCLHDQWNWSPIIIQRGRCSILFCWSILPGYFFFIIISGVGLNVTRYCGHFWPIVQSQMIDEGDCGVIGGISIPWTLMGFGEALRWD